MSKSLKEQIAFHKAEIKRLQLEIDLAVESIKFINAPKEQKLAAFVKQFENWYNNEDLEYLDGLPSKEVEPNLYKFIHASDDINGNLDLGSRRGVLDFIDEFEEIAETILEEMEGFDFSSIKDSSELPQEYSWLKPDIHELRRKINDPIWANMFNELFEKKIGGFEISW